MTGSIVPSAISERWWPISTRIASVAAEALVLAMAGRSAHIGFMSSAPQIAEVAALVGDPARANICVRCLTAAR
jgi:hypothetical protein